MRNGRIRLHRADAVATVVLDRPEAHNALTAAMWRDLAETVRQLSVEETIRVIVIRGAGDRAFSAGADIREFPERRTGFTAAWAYDRLVSAALEAVQEAPQPVLAVLRGLAVGGGLELAAACDVRIASDDARLGLPIGRLGVMSGLAETRTLLRLLPPGKIVELVMRGELITAGEAERMGLVTEVAPVEELEVAVQRWIDRLLTLSPETLRATKELVRLATSGITPEDPRYRALMASVYESDAYREGVRAFLEKRGPAFGAIRTSQDAP
ncbi:enoyl-CoA hydratase-related protein [Thermomicrobium sp. CFH 73360]|uniref:enoyl-CoA hydratase/isomerase family protein n=1 Tax=Thermomicrobium sp. CFH 73360 TaxID=2951987 RepID=UPI00207774D5|nr:enoyl-CoA hydratase-related protein [Thermomicrobium sp. CFH 73360]MCM8746171.1 enoyl-CoA hydratase-related protein [Thermomicrobium sp. CFH 73360]